MMALERLARKQVELKQKQKLHRGRQAKLPEENRDEDRRLMLACLLLNRGWSVSLVAINEKVQLPVDRVQRLSDALNG